MQNQKFVILKYHAPSPPRAMFRHGAAGLNRHVAISNSICAPVFRDWLITDVFKDSPLNYIGGLCLGIS